MFTVKKAKRSGLGEAQYGVWSMEQQMGAEDRTDKVRLLDPDRVRALTTSGVSPHSAIARRVVSLGVPGPLINRNSTQRQTPFLAVQPG